MLRALHNRRDSLLRSRVLDPARQIALFATAYLAYEAVRGAVGTAGARPFADATRIIDFERALRVFAEPGIQSWAATHARWLLEIADWTYLNAQLTVTTAALVFIYLRRNDSFPFVRNMFMVAMVVALIGYCVYPTAPPRLMPRWGFSDSIRQFTGVDAERGAVGALVNPYAAVPSLHVCFALMISVPMSRLVRSGIARVLWLTYPAVIVFVVVVTGNHYFVDVALGALTAAISARLARRLSARRSTTLCPAADARHQAQNAEVTAAWARR